MKDKVSRRTLLRLAMTSGIGLASAAHVATADPQASPTSARPKATREDPYEVMLHRYGGELGGKKIAGLVPSHF